MKKNYSFKGLTVKLLFLGGLLLNANNAFANESLAASPVLRNEANLSTQKKSDVEIVVTDAQSLPLYGAVVISVDNPSLAGIVGGEGKVVLPLESNASVKVELMGYKSKTVAVNGRSSFTVVLDEDAIIIDDIVVVGFGTQKKVNLTGSVSMIDAEVLESRPVQNVSQALQGVIPGLNLSVGTGGGSLDSDLAINIRGAGTIGAGSSSSPLILIDGVEGNMNAVNPNDIESVSVLKDAASTAIYGSRAAFGVILITTKGGKSGKVQIAYSGNFRFSEEIGTPDMVDSYTFARYFNAASRNTGSGTDPFSAEVIERIQQYQAGEITYGTVLNKTTNRWQGYTGAHANTNWFNVWYGDWAPSQEHNISASGGNEKTQYRISAGLLDQKGLLAIGSDTYKRYTLNARINSELTNWLDVVYNVKWSREDFNKPSFLSPVFFHDIVRRWPTNPMYDENGNYADCTDLQIMEHGGVTTKQIDYLTNQIQLIAEPIKNWRIIADGSYKTTSNFYHSTILPTYAYDGDNNPYALARDDGYSAGQSRVYESADRANYTNTNIYTDYEFATNNGHSFKVMGGFNAELYQYRTLAASGYGLISPDVPALGTTTYNPAVSGGLKDWASAGFFGRFNYNYNERYLAEVNFRYDGSSRFVGKNQWGSYPSISLGWNIARENFFAPLADKITTLKLRGSWGQSGNMNTDNYYPYYQTMPVYSSGSNWLLNGERPNYSTNPGLVSSTLTWETIESWNVGVDFAAFKNRLTGSFDYFQRTTKDMIGPAPELPSNLGTAVPNANNADMLTYGFELELKWRDKIGQVGYGISAVLSDSQSKVLNYANDSGLISNWYRGRYFGEIWGYQTAGIATTQDEMDAHLANNSQISMGTNWAAGDIMYKDINGDGEVNAGDGTLDNPGDRSIIGNSTARYNFGFTLEADYKGFDFRAYFQGTAKRDLWLSGPYFFGHSGGMWQSTAFTEHMDYFRPEGDEMGANLNAYYARPIQGIGKNQYAQTHYLQNGAYVRLKNVQLGYSLPKKVLSKLGGVDYVRVYLSADNLWTGTSLSKIFDPETVYGGWGDGKTYPLATTISCGLNINF